MAAMGNPFQVAIQDVVISKFNGGDRMSILPQVIEVNLFQSIFSPVLKASLAINDFISLINNYPITGEENIEIIINQGSTSGGERSYKLEFVVSSIKDILINPNNRNLVYNIELVSKEAFNNAKLKVSKAYHSTIEIMIENVAKEFLKTQKKINFLTETKVERTLVVPNMSPFTAISWLTKYAVSAQDSKYYSYSFYETLSNEEKRSKTEFTFKSIQRPSWKGLLDEAAIENAKRYPYFYVSNIEMIRNNQEAYKNLVGRGYSEDRAITNVKINKRYSTFEKIIGGYFESEYVEVNMLQKDYKITPYNTKTNPLNSFYKTKLNTKDYVDSVINHDERKETSGRTRYIINNYDDENQPSLRNKFGYDAASVLAFNQLDLSIGIQTDMTIKPGDVFYADIPEFHGFNKVESDKYMTGIFLISEIKNTIRPSGETVTMLRINKDSYLNSIFENSLYTTSGSTSTGRVGGPV